MFEPGMFEPGERIYLPGAAGEPTALVQAVFASPGVAVTTTFIPGVNRLDSAVFGEGTIVTGLFMQPSLADAQRDGRFRHLPLSYAATLKWLREGDAFDTCIVQVAPPDAAGRCSLGPAAEFTPEVLRRARRVIGVVNPLVPRVVHGVSIAHADIDIEVAAATPLRSYPGGTEAVADGIASQVARFITDGAALQTGLGNVPNALMRALQDRRGLRLHSGMLSDGVIGLAEQGALDPAWPHTTTAVLGSARLYEWIGTRRDIHIRGVEHTHDPVVLAGLERFVSVHAALEVDLLGQCNLELANGRAVSGAGGAPDFARAARLSAGGISIVALPATFGAARASRIVARLGTASVVSIPRTDVDVLVSEHGAADLRGRSIHERAAAIIDIAAPEHRPGLQAAWRETAGSL